jgi:hypothetical protein
LLQSPPSRRSRGLAPFEYHVSRRHRRTRRTRIKPRRIASFSGSRDKDVASQFVRRRQARRGRDRPSRVPGGIVSFPRNRVLVAKRSLIHGHQEDHLEEARQEPEDQGHHQGQEVTRARSSSCRRPGRSNVGRLKAIHETAVG